MFLNKARGTPMSRHQGGGVLWSLHGKSTRKNLSVSMAYLGNVHIIEWGCRS
jgi:hypothetical protein